MYTHCIHIRGEDGMNATVQKWGNSLALRIPSSVAKDLQVGRGSSVDILVEDGRMIVRPAKKRKVSLARLIHGMTEKNRHSAHDWGAPVGRELL